MKKIFLILGVPGSKKTLQAKMLAKDLNAILISWSESIQSVNYMEEKLDYLSGNDSIPSKITLQILHMNLEKLSSKQNIIIEGYPKHLKEAKELLEYLQKSGIEKFECVININTTKDFADKNKDTNLFGKNWNFEMEYESYLNDYQPTLKFLHSKANTFFNINGNLEPKSMHSEILYKINRHVKDDKIIYKKISEAYIPTKYGLFKVISYQSIINYDIHLAVINGEVTDKIGVPLRVHSSCITGDIFGSLKCDCGKQLDEALKYIKENGIGVVLYLFQEGRGINIINKLRAYSLQSEGLDTVEANEALGLPAELREYGIVKDMINDLKIKSIKLLTNNPDKVNQLLDNGISIESRIPLEIKPLRENEKYLKTKKKKMGHYLTF